MADDLDPNAGAGGDGSDPGAGAGNGGEGAGNGGNGGEQGGAQGAGDGQGSQGEGGQQSGAAGDGTGDGGQAKDWRTEVAGEDKDLLGFLGRYASLKALAEAAKKDRAALRKGEGYKLPDEPTAEELATYRKEHGIPAEVDGYLEALPDGLVIGDDDRGEFGLDPFLGVFHELNLPKSVTDKLIGTYLGQVEAAQAAQVAAQNDLDRQAEGAAAEALRDEWGADYKRNRNVVENYVSGLPEEVRDAFDKGRGPDGIALGHNPAVMKWLAAQALEANPLATVVPGAGAQASTAIADEIATLEKQMGNPNSDYWKGPQKDKLQARYRELVTARDKMKEKG